MHCVTGDGVCQRRSRVASAASRQQADAARPFVDGNGVGAEVILPVYQNLNGPQLKDNWTG